MQQVSSVAPLRDQATYRVTVGLEIKVMVTQEVPAERMEVMVLVVVDGLIGKHEQAADTA